MECEIVVDEHGNMELEMERESACEERERERDFKYLEEFNFFKVFEVGRFGRF